MERNAAETVALRALAHVVSDAEQGPRLLALTGLDAACLRARAGDPVLLGAVLDFLANHEPCLIACAAALDVTPATLILAREAL